MEPLKENYNMLMVKNNVSIVVYDIGFFQIKNIFLSDTKKNIIMDGKFTKIIYSDDLITTHGIFLKIPFQNVGKPEPQHITTILSKSPQLQISKTKLHQFTTINHVSDMVHDIQFTCVKPIDGLITSSDNIELSNLGKSSPSCAEATIYAPEPKIGAVNILPEYSNKITENVNDISNTKFKQIYKLQSHDILNSKNINDIIRIEIQILEFYKQLFQCKKKIIFMLKEQLQDGNIKLYKEHFYNYIKFPRKQNYYMPNVILKISGIWETEDNIGLTYKFIEYTLDNTRKTTIT